MFIFSEVEVLQKYLKIETTQRMCSGYKRIKLEISNRKISGIKMLTVVYCVTFVLNGVVSMLSSYSFWGKTVAQAKTQDAAATRELTGKTLDETLKYRDFKASGTQGILNRKIASIILPLLADHVLREANHYIRILKCIHVE